MRLKCLLLLFGICLIISGNVFAGWRGPTVAVVGTWGSETGKFGIEYGEPFDDFPKNILIDNNGNIIIGDTINSRVQVFYKNKNISSFTYKNLKTKRKMINWPTDRNGLLNGMYIDSGYNSTQFYDYKGNITSEIATNGTIFYGIGTDGNIYYLKYPSDNFIYYKYSSSGQLLATYDAKPLIFGVETDESNLLDGNHLQVVEYKDVVFRVVSSNGLSSFTRDKAGNLYGVGEVKGTLGGSWRYRVYKYDKCSRFLGNFDFPEKKINEVIDSENPSAEAEVIVEEEYGPPVVSPDGSIYCWKRTPDTYSILKWTWVDSPDDPKGGPDAPADLKVAPSSHGLFLAWTASPQDPGCVEGYEVERYFTASGSFSNITTTAPGVVKYNDTGAIAGSSYDYRIRAKSSCGPSPYTAVVSGKRL